jgi:hypothetical protein
VSVSDSSYLLSFQYLLVRMATARSLRAPQILDKLETNPSPTPAYLLVGNQLIEEKDVPIRDPVTISFKRKMSPSAILFLMTTSACLRRNFKD